jgi:cyclopropane-fatty-acyl-phospholipid synthase
MRDETMIHSCGARFAPIACLLAPAGLARVQPIFARDQRFTRSRATPERVERVFPGCVIPSLATLAPAIASSSLSLEVVGPIGPHYADVIREWRRRVHAAWRGLRALGYDAPFERVRDSDVASRQACFRMRSLADPQLLLAHPGEALAP